LRDGWRRSHAALLRHRDGEPQTAPQEDEDTINDRWAAEDAQLTGDEARERCAGARERLFSALRDVPAEEWDGVIDLIARDDTIIHPRAHIRHIQGQRSSEGR
jgi:hypothetical protein